MTDTVLHSMIVLMSIIESLPEAFFAQLPESAYWDDPQGWPTFLVPEHIDRLTEDDVPIAELEGAYAVEAMIWGTS